MKAKRKPRPRAKVVPNVATADRLDARIRALMELGIKPPQIARLLGLSYSGMHKLLTGRIRPAVHRLVAYHANLDSWVSSIGAQ